MLEKDLVRGAVKRRLGLFSEGTQEEAVSVGSSLDLDNARRVRIAAKIAGEYKQAQFLAKAAEKSDQQQAHKIRKKQREQSSGKKPSETVEDESPSLVSKVVAELGASEKQSESSTALVIGSKEAKNSKLKQLGAVELAEEQSLAVQTRRKPVEPVKPEWHAPWILKRVIAGHVGWVRCVAVDPSNKFFFTGSNDRTIKCWDLASGKLKLTLTSHAHAVLGLAVSEKYPYLFSVGDDKTVKCWDLETNKVIRHYHGHIQSVHSVAVHPKLDVLVTGSRDASVRVWDLRTRHEVHLLTGHQDTVQSLIVQSVDPQIISGSMDKTIRLWDLAAGKCLSTLTHHKKSIRALVRNPREFSFASGAADMIKKWECRTGKLLLNLRGHNSIVNTLAVNQNNVLFSGGDDGSMRFWDWQSGHCFFETQTTPQPGSLESERCVLASAFDMTGTRLITCEADKSVKIWHEDPDATESSHPLQWDRDKAAQELLNEVF